jgi:hypothetical protein
MVAILESALPSWLKPYALALAKFARDDGTRVFPKVATVAKLTGRKPRAVQYAVAELRGMGLLKALTPAGRYRAIHYQFIREKLPQIHDGEQLPLALDERPQGFPQGHRHKTPRSGDFHRDPQPWVQPGARMGATRCTRSVHRSL